MAKDGIIPTRYIEADSISEAHYKAIKTVWEEGMDMRTQYDRKNDKGDFIDPPGKDARVLIHVKNPFSEPRFPPLSHCERGKYILELMGAKDSNVIPRAELLRGIDEEAGGTEWPYTYSQRLRASPVEGGVVNQVSQNLQRLVEDNISRRAVMTTRVPEIDAYLKVDIPCLGEVHLRAPEDENGVLTLNMTTYWRSRDLFKAWPDNTIAVTYMGRGWANDLAEKLQRPVNFKGYADMSNSLHIYGQDFSKIQGDDKGHASFFDIFPTVESYVGRSMDSESATIMEILPQMKELARQKDQWKFTQEEEAIIQREIDFLEAGNLA